MAKGTVMNDVTFEALSAEQLVSCPYWTKNTPLTIWAVSDGRAGIENQALGLAEAMGRHVPVQIVRQHVRFKDQYDRLPTLFKLMPHRMLAEDSARIEAPWPDLWIGTGRASMPFALRMRGWSRGETFVVQTQDPRWPSHLFDAVVAPRHDRVVGENVIEITGSPHRVNAAKLDQSYQDFFPLFEGLPQTKVAVLIGGKSKAFDLSLDRASKLAIEIGQALETEQAALLMTFSRRTPEAARHVFEARLRGLPGHIWNGEGPNPYFAFLAAADFILVTEDSTNMATEAAATGKPVFILKMDGQSLKFRRFHEDLEAKGAARPFGGALYRWTYEPVDETDRAAREILSRMILRREAAMKSAQ